MATVLGNAAIFLDLISHQNPALPDRKPGIHPPLPHLDLILLSLTSKRDPFSKAFETEPDRRIRRDRAVAAWGKASNDGFECKEDENESGREEWEAELKRRLKEIEEMKELEKKAEELQSRAEKERNGPGRPEEDSEEEKRMRVRKDPSDGASSSKKPFTSIYTSEAEAATDALMNILDEPLSEGSFAKMKFILAHLYEQTISQSLASACALLNLDFWHD